MKKKKKKYVRPTITVLSDEFDITMENNVPVCSTGVGEKDLMNKKTSFDSWDDEDDECLPVAGKVRKRVWEDE